MANETGIAEAPSRSALVELTSEIAAAYDPVTGVTLATG